MEPSNALVYEIIQRNISLQQYLRLVESVRWKYAIEEEDFRAMSGFETDVAGRECRTHFCRYLARQGIFHRENLSAFRSLLWHISRYDLVIKVRKFEIGKILKRGSYGFKVATSSLFTLERWILTRFLLEALGMLGLVFLVFSSNTLDTTLRAILLAPFSIAWAYYFYRLMCIAYYKYRFIHCSWGCVPNSFMSFKFTTFDIQFVSVVDNVEFEWDVLSYRLNLNFDPKGGNAMYYLNTNRCIFGDAQKNSNSFDRIQPIRGAEIFAVDEGGKNVYYHSGDQWHPYISAKDIQLHDQLRHGFSWLKGCI